jgi:hypothetical protein
MKLSLRSTYTLAMVLFHSVSNNRSKHENRAASISAETATIALSNNIFLSIAGGNPRAEIHIAIISSMNSTAAASKARRIAKMFAVVSHWTALAVS